MAQETARSFDSKVAKKLSGVRRWRSALRNSRAGLMYGLKTQRAIREELIALAIAVPLSFVVIDSGLWRLLAILSVLFVLIVEVLNTAIEISLDRISIECHELTKAAKDMGSLAVLLAIGLSVCIWLAAIFGVPWA